MKKSRTYRLISFVVLTAWIVNTILPMVVFQNAHENNRLAFHKRVDNKSVELSRLHFSTIGEIQFVDGGKELWYENGIYDIVDIEQNDDGITVTCELDHKDVQLHQHRNQHRKQREKQVQKEKKFAAVVIPRQLMSWTITGHTARYPYIDSPYLSPVYSPGAPPPDSFIS